MKDRVYNLDISSENSLVTVTANGTYTLKNIKDLIHAVIKDPLYRSQYNSIIDIRDVIYTPEFNEVLAISNFVNSFKHYFKGKVAIIARGKILYNMFRLSTVFVSRQGIKSNIFMDPEEAMAWLENPATLQIH